MQNLPTRRPRVYLAGPSVFRPNAKVHLASLAALCERHGLTPLLPTDDCVGDADAPLARRIYESNTQMLRSADGVLADLQEWRGHEPDSGTAFEVGFAAALELPIVGYGAPVDCYADRVSKTRTCERDALGMLRECDSQMAVEDFGMPLNLMLGCSAVLVNSEEEGIELLAAMLRHGPASSRKGTFDSWLQARVLDYNARKVAG
ncbi:MAG: nucleoside 2-deoxyribosyltransferase [Pseudomonas sp.]|nr:MAG: nucleoside 2-deoxyribosyltransferase [Pseudomonas sp.]